MSTTRWIFLKKNSQVNSSKSPTSNINHGRKKNHVHPQHQNKDPEEMPILQYDPNQYKVALTCTAISFMGI